MASDVIRMGSLEIDLNNYRLYREGQLLRLTPTEWALLRELMNHPNQVLSHRSLLQRVWGNEYSTESDYVHTYVSRLRRKLEHDATNPEFILTEPGIGYRFNADLMTEVASTVTSLPTEDVVLLDPLQDRNRFINPLPQHVESRYVGRVAQRALLRELLLENTRLVSIYGRAGVGKTALACTVLSELQQTNNFDGMVFLSATSTGITFGRILSDFQTLLGDLPPSQPDPQATLYKITHLLDRLSGGKYILLLDNLEHLQDPITNDLKDQDMETFFRVALEQGSTLRILVTSRYPLNLPRTMKVWERIVPLEDGLNREDGMRFLRSSDLDGVAGLRESSDSILGELVRRTHGLPRALEAIAGILLESPLMTPDDLLADEPFLTAELGEMFVQGAIQNLSPDAVRVMELVSVFERRVPLRLLEAFARAYLDQPLKPIVNRLVRAYFLGYNTDDRTVSMHPIDRDYCYQRIPLQASDGYDKAALHRYAATLYDEDFDWEAPATSLVDLANPLAAFNHWVSAKEYDTAAQLLLRLDRDYMAIWGNYPELADLYAHLMGQVSAPETNIQTVLRYGEALRRVGRLTQAIELFELGLRLAQEASNLQHIASALSSLGWAHYDTGQFEDAIGFWEDALTNFRQVGDRFGEGDLLSGLGWVSYLVGAYDQALTYIEEGFRIFGEIGGQLHRIGVNIGDSGVIRAAQGDYELAIKNLREALAITEVTNSINERSYKGGYLAMALLLAGSPQEAEATARTALQYDVPANRHVVAALHGIALAQLGRPQDASNAFEKAKESAENLLKYTSRLYTARYARALALAGLGLLRDEPLTAAIEEYQRAKAMCSTAGVIQSNANLLGALMVYPQGKRLAPLIALVTNNE